MHRFRGGAVLLSLFIAANVTLGIVIHTTDVRFLTHEYMHIGDIERSLPSALQRFTSLPMTNEPACATLARAMSTPSFAAAIMNQLSLRSSARFGCNADETRSRAPTPGDPQRSGRE